MADKQISSLPAATSVDDNSLFVVEQQGTAMSASGALWKGFAVQAVQPFANAAQQAAQAAQNAAQTAGGAASGVAEDAQRAEDAAGAAEQSAQQAAASATAAASSAEAAEDSADKSEQYGAHPPIIQNDTWWIWNAETQQYEDSGEPSRGGILFATFYVDYTTGCLWQVTPDAYNGPEFELNNGFLEVSINNA